MPMLLWPLAALLGVMVAQLVVRALHGFDRCPCGLCRAGQSPVDLSRPGHSSLLLYTLGACGCFWWWYFGKF